MMPLYRHHPQLAILLVVIVALALLAGGLLAVLQVLGTPETTIAPLVPDTAILEGTYVCLPRTDEKKVAECTPGLRTNDGTLYALDLGPLIGMGGDPQLKNGEKISAGGELVHIDELSTDQWDSYSVTELMRVEEIARP